MAELITSGISDDIIIRDLKAEDVPHAMRFVLAEGWNQTDNDWLLFISNPGNVCKAAEIGGRLVGTTASMNYLYDKAWISMVLVDREFRGQGISRMLMDMVLKGLKSCKTIKLDATVEGLSGYRKFGFIDDYRILELVNPSFRSLPIAASNNKPEPITQKNISAVIDFDKHAFGADRSVLIRYLVNNFPDNSWLISQNNELKGYALGRKGNKYYRIGPVSAHTAEDARKLIRHALAQLSGQPVVIDLLEDKNDLTDWLISLGFTEKRYFTRMFQYKNLLPGRLNLLYAIAGPEFG